jgi:hypothetical protein
MRPCACFRLCGVLLVVVGAAQIASPAAATSIGLNYTGVTLAEGKALNSNSGYAPPDNAGAVGPNNVVQLINGAYAVYDKATGQRTQTMSAKDFWTAAGVNPGNDIANLGTFNARVLYDPTVDRWFAAAVSGQTTNNLVMVARSNTSNPGGGWQAVSFLGNDGGPGKFADYTALGIDANGVYVTTNNFNANASDAGFFYVSAYSLPKADLMAPTPSIANMTRFDQIDAGNIGVTVQPVVNFGPTSGHAPLLAAFAPASSFDQIFRTDISGGGAANATLSDPTMIVVNEYFNPPRALQPDGVHTISTIDDRIASHVYQVGDKLYAVHNTMVDGRSALAWLKIDETTNAVLQEGLLHDPNFDYFNGSIAANQFGDLVIGFTRSGLGAGGNLSAFAAVGHTAAGVTTFDTPLLLKGGLVGNYNFINGRWGDFTTTVVDPSNPYSFWTFQQYADGTTSWATQVTQILVPEPQGLILATAALAALLGVARKRRRRCARLTI